MLAVRISDVDARKIPRIIFHPQGLLQPSSPWAQDIIPVTNLVKVNAISLNDARLGGQEIQEECFGTGRIAERLLSFGDAFSPSLQRRLAERRMDGEMINACDLQR